MLFNLELLILIFFIVHRDTLAHIMFDTSIREKPESESGKISGESQDQNISFYYLSGF